MNSLAVLLLSGMIGFAGLALLLWLTPAPAMNPLEERLSSYPVTPLGVPEEPRFDDAEVTGSLKERLVDPVLGFVGSRAVKLLPANRLEQINTLIQVAGRPGGVTAKQIAGRQVAMACAFFILGIGVVQLAGAEPPANVLLPIIALAFGFNFPTVALARKAKARQHEIEKAIPDMIDLITINVEAGLSLEASLRKVCEKFKNELTEEFRRTLNEYTLGKPLPVAMKDMADRLELKPLQSLVRVVIQSDQLGTSLGLMLRVQSEQLRRDRRAKAEEMGQKAPVKMLLPMVGCIFPTLFIILLGPAVIHIFMPNAH